MSVHESLDVGATPTVSVEEIAAENHSSAELIAGAGLVATSAFAFWAQRTNYYFHQGVQHEYVAAAMNSMAHPALGYIGAALGASAVAMVNRHKSTSINNDSALFAGATGLNFSAEYVQQKLLFTDYNFLEHTETLKDYAFALGGMMLYKVITRKKS